MFGYVGIVESRGLCEICARKKRKKRAILVRQVEPEQKSGTIKKKIR